MKLIVGFGNPGERYVNNRINIGFKVIDILANNANIDVRIKKKKSLIGKGKIKNSNVVLLKPQTFVDLLGESVLYIASFLRIDVRDIVCIFEDPTLELGELRVDYLYSKFTHEGIESIKKSLRSNKFAKVRIGVGQPAEGENKEAYLLKDFTEEEHLVLINILNKAEAAVLDLITESIEYVQEKYNPEGVLKVKKREVVIRRK